MPPQVNPPALAVGFVIIASIFGAWVWAILRLAMRLPVLPRNTPRIVPWGGWSVLLALFVTLIAQGVTSIAFNLATTGKPLLMPLENGLPSPKAMMTVTLLANMASIVVVSLVLYATSGATFRDFGLHMSGLGGQVARGIVAYPLLAPVVFGMMLVALKFYDKTDHPLEKAIASSLTPGMVVVMALTSVVGAPVGEEFLFRGVILGWLTRVALGGKARPVRPEALGEELPSEVVEGGFVVVQGPDDGYVPADFGDPSMNPYEAPRTAILAPPGSTEPAFVPTRRYGPLLAANVATSLVFAALHAGAWPTPIPIFFLSIGLGVLYQRTGSILAPIALHMTFNGASTLMMFLSISGSSVPAPGPNDVKPIPPPARVQPVGKDAVVLGALGDRTPILEKKS